MDFVTIIGSRAVDFADKETGRRITGTRIYYEYDDPGVDGRACDSAFVRDRAPAVGAVGVLLRDRRGKVVGWLDRKEG